MRTATAGSPLSHRFQDSPMTARVWFPRAAVLCIAIAGVVFVAGCGPKIPPTGEVYGKVVYKDKPVTAGRVKFVPTAGDPVSTELLPDGTYRATGVPLGQVKVAVETADYKN